MKLKTVRQSLKKAGRKAVDLFAEVYDGPENSRVAPECDRETIQHLFAGTIGNEGIGLDAAIDEFTRVVLPNSMRTPHPLYLGLVNTSPLPAAVLADLLDSTLNNNGGAFHQGPAMWGAEQEVLREFARMLGLRDASAMFVPGGSYANLQCLLLARTARFPEWTKSGPIAVTETPIIYTSDACHLSVTRAASAMGIGNQGVVAVSAIGRGVLDVQALSEQIKCDRRAGHRPFAVVATAGTTGTGAIDPISDIAELCRENELWLHVDACYGGGAVLLAELREQLGGIHLADSVAVDPHEWFFMPMTAAIVLTRHPEVELEAFDVSATYIPDDGHVEAYRRGIPTSRRCCGLTVWMALRAHGWNTIREAVRRNIQLTRMLEKLLAERGFSVLPDGALSIACARREPPGWEPEHVDCLQEAIAREVVQRGKAWFATVRHGGNTWLRFNILNLHTREKHVRELAELLYEVSILLTDQQRR